MKVLLRHNVTIVLQSQEAVTFIVLPGDTFIVNLPSSDATFLKSSYLKFSLD